MLSVLQPPPTAEELALKDEVAQVLTRQGVLAKIKAELRAAVFDVMHEREGFQTSIDAPKLSDFSIETRTIALSLIVECLRFFHWEHTLRVLLTEINTENEQHDSELLVKKLGLSSDPSLANPVLFQLVECQVAGGNQRPVAAETLLTTEQRLTDEAPGDEGEWSSNASASAIQAVELDIENVHQAPLKVSNTILEVSGEAKDEEDKSSAENEESMAEEVVSESEVETSDLTNDEGFDQSVTTIERPSDSIKHFDDESQGSDKALEGSHEMSDKDEAQESDKGLEDSHEMSDKDEAQESDKGLEDSQDLSDNDRDEMSMAVPPPAPANLPSLPPIIGSALAKDSEDDFDADKEAERLRKLDAALQAMEAEDETGTLQQLKASLQLELQEQDSFVSSGGLDLDSEEAEDGDDVEGDTKAEKNEDDDEDDEDYGTSDFEEEEEIASDISEELESMPELSDREDDSEEDELATAATEIEPPRVLQFDTRVDSEDALNSYDYIETVEKDV